MTAHKSQGQMINKAIVDLAACHGTEAPYVMVSHVHLLNDLLILHPFGFDKIKCHMSQDAQHELTQIHHHHLTMIMEYGSLAEQTQAALELHLLELKHTNDVLLMSELCTQEDQTLSDYS